MRGLVCLFLIMLSSRAFGWADGVTSLVWETSGEVRSSPAIAADGSIIIGNNNGELYSLNPDDGTTNLVWNAGDLIYSSPAIGRDGTIYVGSGDKKLYAFDPNGDTSHVWTVGDRIFMSSPAVEGSTGRIYVGSEDRKLYSFNADGTTARVWSTAGEIQSSPALSADGTIYAGSDDGKFYAFNQDGTTSRVWTTGGAIRSSPAIGTNGMIHVGSGDGNLYAFNPNGSTSRVWSTLGAVYSSPVIGTSGVVYVGSFDNHLYAFNPDGTTSRVWSTTGPVESAPALGSDGTIYAGTRDGYFYAFNPDGATDFVWQAAGTILSSPSISSNGTIYVGASDGNVYAFTGTGGGLAESPWPKFRQNRENTGFLFSGPTNIACSEGVYADRVRVAWAAPIALGGATGYEVWRNTSNDIASADNLGTAAGLVYDDATAVAGVTYYYWVRATNEAWISRFGTPDYGYRAIVASPGAPSSVSASQGEYFGNILVSWSTVGAATGYEVWRNDCDDFSGSEKISADGLSTNNYADTGPPLGEMSYYWVKATNAAGSSGFSKPSASGYRDLAPPSGVTASIGDYSDKVQITWGSVANATAYLIFRNTNSNSSEAEQIGFTSSLIFDDITGEYGNIYNYWVKSVANVYTGIVFSASVVGSFGGTTSHVWNVTYGVGAPVIGTNGVIYVGAGESGAKFYGFNPDGTTNRVWNLGGTIGKGATIGNDGTIYVPGAWSNKLYALNPNGTTSRVWSASDAILAPPAIGSNGIIYAGSYDGKLYAFNTNGTTNSVYSSGGSAFAPAIGSEGTIYSVRGSSMFAFTTAGATSQVWTITGSIFSASPAISSDGIIYAPSQAGSLYAFNPDGTTSRMWTVSGAAHPLASSPAIGSGGTIYVGCDNYNLYAFNPNGSTSRVWRLDGPVRSSPAIGSDGTIYVGSEGGKFYALNSNGTTNRFWTAPGAVYSSPAIGTNGLIYASLSSGTESMLCAYFGTGGMLADTAWPKAWHNNRNTSRDSSVGAVPAAPTGVSAGKGGSTNAVAISWNSTTRATSYQIYRNTTNDSATASFLASIPSGTYYSDVSAERAPLYYYWIRAKNALGTGDFSVSDSGCLTVPPPGAVSATAGVYTDKVSVEWQAMTPHSGSASYEVWRGTLSNSSVASRIITVVATSYNDFAVSAGTRYYYWIRTKDSYGTSEDSAAASGYSALSPPQGLSATAGVYRDKVQLTWNASSGAEGYEVWRGMDDMLASSKRIERTTKTYYDDFSVTSRVVYFYWVKATNSLNTSGFGDVASGYSLADVIPDSPSYVYASKGTYTGKIAVTWGVVSNANGYQVWRNTNDAIVSATQLAIETGTSYDDTMVQKYVSYYYWVKATNSAGASSFGAFDTGYSRVPPEPPASVSATDGIYTNKIEITWTAAPDATGYQLWRNTNSSSAGASMINATQTTEFTDTNIVREVLYYYWVKATNSAGASSFSAFDTGYINVPPAPPASVSATDGIYTNKIEITWTAAPDATGYQLWRNTNSSSAGAYKIAETETTAFVDTNIVRGILYYYWVRSTDLSGTGDFSSPDTGYSRAHYVVNDYNGDGKSDLAVFDGNSGYWFVSDLNEAILQHQWGWSSAIPVPGDYDADGKSDFAVFDASNGYWYICSATNSLIAWQQAWGWPGAVPVPGDYDGDGKSDLAVFDSGSGCWYIRSVSGSYIKGPIVWGWPGAEPVPGDFDGDGKSDLAVFDSNTGYWYIISLDGRLLAWGFPWGWPGATPVSGDYTGDGKTDIAVFDENSSSWYIISLDGTLIAWAVAWGVKDSVPVAGDYTGNGMSDLAVFDMNTGDWYIISLDGELLAFRKSWGWPGTMPVGLGVWQRYKPDPDDPSNHSAIGSWKTSAAEIFNIMSDGTVTGTDSGGHSFTGTWTASSETKISFSIYRSGGSYKNPFTIEVLTETTGKVSNSSGVSANLTRI